MQLSRIAHYCEGALVVERVTKPIVGDESLGTSLEIAVDKQVLNWGLKSDDDWEEEVNHGMSHQYTFESRFPLLPV
jgi:hypothetical protein